jgi:hypothetical protein
VAKEIIPAINFVWPVNIFIARHSLGYEELFYKFLYGKGWETPVWAL